MLSAFSALPITVPATGLSTSSASGCLSASASGGGAAMHVDGAKDVDMDGAATALGGHGRDASPAAATLSVKYLTSSKLFGLQVHTGFRVHGGVECRCEV